MWIVLEKIIKKLKNNKLILKSQQTFRSERHKVFTEEVNKIALSANMIKDLVQNDQVK